jgi:rhodanese-related sulfurtransferase
MVDLKSPGVLGGIALVLGALAVVAGSPNRRGSSLDVIQLAKAVEGEEDHVTAVELARWIRDRKPDLRIIDIRDSADFDSYHIPGAERFSLEDLSTRGFDPEETLVLYSGGGAHAAQGWVFLRARGLRNVFFLRGGLDEWLDEVINPQFPRNASASDRLVMDSVAALSRYFDGSPRVVDSVTSKTGADDHSASWKDKVAKKRGRGC